MRAHRHSSSTPPRLPRVLRVLRVVLAGSIVASALAAVDVGPDDVVVVVAARSPTVALSRNELADLFLGRGAHFPDGRPAVPIDQREGTAARAKFNAEYLSRTAAQIKAHWSKVIFTGRGSPPRALADGEQVRRLVASGPGFIGYLERRLVDDSLKIVKVE